MTKKIYVRESIGYAALLLSERMKYSCFKRYPLEILGLIKKCVTLPYSSRAEINPQPRKS